MANVIKEIDLYVNRENTIKLWSKQFDTSSRVYLCRILDDMNEQIIVDDSDELFMIVTRPDGEVSHFNAMSENGKVKILLTYWMLKVSGEANCQLVMKNNEGRLSTLSFIVTVQEGQDDVEDTSWMMVDDTLTKEGQAADAKAVGDAIAAIERGEVTEVDPTVPQHVKDITEEDIERWNNNTGSGFSGDYNDLTNKPDIPVVPTDEITKNTNARHSHSNKGVLNGITEDKISHWDSSMERCVLKLVKNANNTYMVTDTENNNLTFDDVLSLVQDVSRYVVVMYGNSKIRPQYATSSEIIFTGLDRSTESKVLRMIFTPTRLEYSTYTLAEKTALSDYYTKTEVDTLNGNKVEQADFEDLVSEVNALGEAIPSDTYINGLIDAKLTPLESLADEILEVM